jgi:hypothetical protein
MCFRAVTVHRRTGERAKRRIGEAPCGRMTDDKVDATRRNCVRTAAKRSANRVFADTPFRPFAGSLLSP